MKKKIIRDIVHGYIPVDEYDLKIIDHPLFQRLLRIQQGMNMPTYPSANHTRFEHSLGVMHLGTKVMEHIISNSEVPTNEKKVLEEKRREVKYACLLHDIGHAPI